MTEETRTMRQQWFDHVRKIRVKMSKGKKDKVTHREAMKLASESWADVKSKILRANKRKANKIAKET